MLLSKIFAILFYLESIDIVRIIQLFILYFPLIIYNSLLK